MSAMSPRLLGESYTYIDLVMYTQTYETSPNHDR